MQQQDNHEYPFLYQRQTCHQVQPNQATYQKRQKSAADKGKDTRDYLAAAFPELNAWERAGADRKSGSAGMPRPISYAVFCLKKKKRKKIWRYLELLRYLTLPGY